MSAIWKALFHLAKPASRAGTAGARPPAAEAGSALTATQKTYIHYAEVKRFLNLDSHDGIALAERIATSDPQHRGLELVEPTKRAWTALQSKQGSAASYLAERQKAVATIEGRLAATGLAYEQVFADDSFR